MAADQSGPARLGWAEGARRNLQLVLPVSEHSVRLARRVARTVLAAWQLPDTQETAILLLSELVMNAIQHARATETIEVELEAVKTCLRIEITNQDPRCPQPRISEESGESGFGFLLLDALATRWGVRQTASGTVVWAELEPPQTGEPES
jgi:anti-sigma regulatory factor (Ser/Thr protein kinase)